ncbi:hypothetical protein C8Q75DRAFT_821283 [Abortiporus biennis]|nr:hypothetical protein C8Q75DRAFT_821283 [Abortiporus biennis]
MSDTITLSPNSLYICLTQIMSPGFHWSLYITDSTGLATRYHWVEVRTRRQAADPIEEYTRAVINPVRGVTGGFRLNYTFVKIRSYTAPTTPFDFHAIFSTIYTTSYNNVRDNREHGIRCGNWVMTALQYLYLYGLLQLNEGQIKEIQTVMTAKGEELEHKVATTRLADTKLCELY